MENETVSWVPTLPTGLQDCAMEVLDFIKKSATSVTRTDFNNKCKTYLKLVGKNRDVVLCHLINYHGVAESIQPPKNGYGSKVRYYSVTDKPAETKLISENKTPDQLSFNDEKVDGRYIAVKFGSLECEYRKFDNCIKMKNIHTRESFYLSVIPGMNHVVIKADHGWKPVGFLDIMNEVSPNPRKYSTIMLRKEIVNKLGITTPPTPRFHFYANNTCDVNIEGELVVFHGMSADVEKSKEMVLKRLDELHFEEGTKQSIVFLFSLQYAGAYPTASPSLNPVITQPTVVKTMVETKLKNDQSTAYATYTKVLLRASKTLIEILSSLHPNSPSKYKDCKSIDYTYDDYKITIYKDKFKISFIDDSTSFGIIDGNVSNIPGKISTIFLERNGKSVSFPNAGFGVTISDTVLNMFTGLLDLYV